MVQANNKVSFNDLQHLKRFLFVHDIDENITIQNIKKLIARKLELNPDNVIVTFTDLNVAHGTECKCAFVKLPSSTYVDTMMEARGKIQFCGRALSMSRRIPREYDFNHRNTTGLLIKIQDNRQMSEEESKMILQNFKQYGKINYNAVTNQKQIHVIFDDYDSVDQIMLNGAEQTIGGCTVHLEKVRVPENRRTIPKSDEEEYCIHVTNLSSKITNEDLAKLFNVHVANVLIRPFQQASDKIVENQRKAYEAWIINIGNKQDVQKLAERTHRKVLRDTILDCVAIVDEVQVVELCKDYQKSKCPYIISCRNRHIQCTQFDTCTDKKCWYGHSSLRNTQSDERPLSEEEGYRIRITGFPLHVRPAEIVQRLHLPFIDTTEYLYLCKEARKSSETIAYLCHEKSRSLVQELIQMWHDKPFSTGSNKTLRCQLELDVDYYDYFFEVRLPSIIINGSQSSGRSSNANGRNANKNKRSPKSLVESKTIKLDNRDQTENNELEKIQLPDPWQRTKKELWTSKRTDTTSNYYVQNRKDREKNAALLIYSAESDRNLQQRLQHYQNVLELLKDIDGIPKLVTSNINTNGKSYVSAKYSMKYWILIDSIETMNLDELIQQRPLTLTFQEIINLTMKLLHLIKRIHKQNVIHRYISPRNILINYDSSMSINDARVGLIDFDYAWIKQIDTSVDPMEDITINKFYQVPQLNEVLSDTNDDVEEIKLARQSPTIDTSLICAILFWLMTKCEPNYSRDEDGKLPHESDKIRKFIDRMIIAEAGTTLAPFVQRHLKLIFDRGFADANEQWSIIELEYQLQLIQQLITGTPDSVHSIQRSSVATKSSTVSTDTLYRLMSFIDKIKVKILNQYPSNGSIDWLNDNKWSCDDQVIINYNTLTIDQSQLPIKLEFIRGNTGVQISLYIRISTNDQSIIKLPVDIFQENSIDEELENIVKTIIVELKTFCTVHIHLKE